MPHAEDTNMSQTQIMTNGDNSQSKVISVRTGPSIIGPRSD